jgi:hypothetical protein
VEFVVQNDPTKFAYGLQSERLCLMCPPGLNAQLLNSPRASLYLRICRSKSAANVLYHWSITTRPLTNQKQMQATGAARW